jgi:glutathione S-transferase
MIQSLHRGRRSTYRAAMTTTPHLPRIALYDWPVSPFCMKVRAVLDHKGLAYQRLPALKHQREIRRRGKVGKVPALDIDGAFFVDSTDIAHELERRFPAPSVLPPDPAERALCHVLEDWADESLYFLGLYYHWHEPQGRRAAADYFGRSLLGKLFFRPVWMRVERQLVGQGTARKSPEHVRSDLERNLDAVEGLLARGDFLLGTRPYLCDFALMAQLVYLSRAAALSNALSARPRALAYLERMKSLRESARARPSAHAA